MRALFSIIGKEFRQHGWVLFGLGLLLLLGILVMVSQAKIQTEVVSPMKHIAPYVTFFLGLSAMVLGNRLVVQEYQTNTYRFFEALPVPRASLLTIKYLLGYFFLIGACLLGVAIAFYVSYEKEPISPSFALLIVSKCLAFLFFVWSFFFAMGLVGRYRIPVYIFSFLAILSLDTLTEIDVKHRGPLALMDATSLATERNYIPLEDMVWAVGLGLLFVIISYGLALVREGSFVEVLSKKMSQRDKSAVVVLSVAWAVAMTMADARKTKEAYQFKGDHIYVSEKIPLQILYHADFFRNDAEKLGSELETVLVEFQQTLGLDGLPQLRITQSVGGDKGFFQQAKLKKSDGLLVRANYQEQNEAQRAALSAFMLKALLLERSHQRAGFEPQKWLLDGFTRWFAQRHGKKDQALEQVLLVQAFVASPYLQGTEQLRFWNTTRERLGNRTAEALAYSFCVYIAQKQGTEALHSLARELFGRDSYRDLREVIYVYRHPLDELLQKHLAIGANEMLQGWRTWLGKQVERDSLAKLLVLIPRLEGRVDVAKKAGLIREVTASFHQAETSTTSVRCRFLHSLISPFDFELSAGRLQAEERHCQTRTSTLSLTGEYGPGDRVFWALEYEVEALPHPVRIYSGREVIR